MDDGKLISFDKYKKRRSKADDSGSDIISTQFRTGAPSGHKDFLDWYGEYYSFDRHKLILCSLFYENHECKGGINPKAGFVVVFTREDLDIQSRSVCKALEALKRTFTVVNAAEKTFRQMGEEISKERCQTANDAMIKFESLLLNTNTVLVIKEISRYKGGLKKGDLVRSLIKILDDAHFKDLSPKADLIFIDHAHFLEEIWMGIREYIHLIPPH